MYNLVFINIDILHPHFSRYGGIKPNHGQSIHKPLNSQKSFMKINMRKLVKMRLLKICSWQIEYFSNHPVREISVHELSVGLSVTARPGE